MTANTWINNKKYLCYQGIESSAQPPEKQVPNTAITSTNKDNPFCGMWKDRADMKDVDAYVRKLRRGRQFY